MAMSRFIIEFGDRPTVTSEKRHLHRILNRLPSRYPVSINEVHLIDDVEVMACVTMLRKRPFSGVFLIFLGFKFLLMNNAFIYGTMTGNAPGTPGALVFRTGFPSERQNSIPRLH